jgi:putative transposase
VPATAVAAAGCRRPGVWSAAVAVRNRLYPAATQVGVLWRHCADARFVWNLAVEQQSWWWPGRGAAPGGAERGRQLAQARAAEPWLAEGSSTVQQQALRDFDRAMAAFFRAENPAGRPRYRGKRGPQGFVIRDTRVRRVSRRWGEVQVPKCGWVRFRWTRALPADLGMARVRVDRAGRWHVAFPAPQPALARRAGGGPVGVDRGVRTALVTSGGQHYRAPRISRRRAARYLALERQLRRQDRGSRRRERTRHAMSQITAAVTDRRRDWAEKISTRLVTDHDVIVFEKLNTSGMVRKPRPRPDPAHPGGFLPNRARSKAGLNRAILSSCWGLLAQRAGQKAAASGAAFIYVDPRFTSQQCHVCGHTAPGNRDSQAVFRCQQCGHSDHADVNAARNILARGLATMAVPAPAPGHGAHAHISRQHPLAQREPARSAA